MLFSGGGFGELQSEVHFAGTRAVVADGYEDVPNVGGAGRAAESDFAEADIFLIRVGREEADVGGDVGERRLLFGNAAGSGEDDFSGALGLEFHRPLRVLEGLLEIERGGSGLRGADGFFDGGAAGFERRGGRGERVGANQHHAVAAGDGF